MPLSCGASVLGVLRRRFSRRAGRRRRDPHRSVLPRRFQRLRELQCRYQRILGPSGRKLPLQHQHQLDDRGSRRHCHRINLHADRNGDGHSPSLASTDGRRRRNLCDQHPEFSDLRSGRCHRLRAVL